MGYLLITKEVLIYLNNGGDTKRGGDVEKSFDSDTEHPLKESDLRDYKFFCFNGVPKYCQVICNRRTNETIDFFDMEWKHQEFTGLSLPSKPYSNSPIPIQFNKMKAFASMLAEDISFVRIDFYEVNGNMYFGELTLYPAGGFGVCTPDEWNLKLGEYINLSKGVYRGKK